MSDLFSNYSRRNLVRKGTIEAIKAQQQLEGVYRQKRLEKEAAEIYVGETIICRQYPPMLDYYMSMAVLFRFLYAGMLLCGGGILLYLLGLSIQELGFAATMKDLGEIISECRWYHIVGIVLSIIFFAAIYYAMPVLVKYLSSTEVIFTDKRVHVLRYLRNEKIITYDEMAKCIQRRKIRIKNGRYVIPYKGGSIVVSVIQGNFPSELFGLLERKCNIALPHEDFKHRAQRSGMGWATGTLGGGIIFVAGLFISLLIFVTEGTFTWEAFYTDIYKNVMLWFAMILVALGLLFRLLFLPSTLWEYRKYYKVMAVSVTPFLMDVLVLALWMAGYYYCFL